MANETDPPTPLLKGNSHKERKESLTPTERPEPNDKEPTKEPLEKVVKTDVIKRKKPLGTKFKETFFGGDTSSAWDFVAYDVLIPAAKDMLADAVSQGFERMIYGEARSSSRRTGKRPGETHYDYRGVSSRRGRSRGREISKRARGRHDFDEIVLATRMEAEEVLDRLYDLLDRYDAATVADLYELVGVTGNYTDSKWGWLDLRGSDVRRVRNGYLLNLPQPEPID